MGRHKQGQHCLQSGKSLACCLLYSLRRLLAQALFIVLLLVFFGGTFDLAFSHIAAATRKAKVAGRFRCVNEMSWKLEADWKQHRCEMLPLHSAVQYPAKK